MAKQAVFNEPTIEFLAEQDGIPERELKAELRRALEGTDEILRAYLAIVQYLGKHDKNIALCLVGTPRSSSNIVETIASIFSKMFQSEEHLDIVFLNASQEQRLSQLCKAFYTRTPKL